MEDKDELMFHKHEIGRILDIKMMFIDSFSFGLLDKNKEEKRKGGL